MYKNPITNNVAKIAIVEPENNKIKMFLLETKLTNEEVFEAYQSYIDSYNDDYTDEVYDIVFTKIKGKRIPNEPGFVGAANSLTHQLVSYSEGLGCLMVHCNCKEQGEVMADILSTGVLKLEKITNKEWKKRNRTARGKREGF